MNRITVPIYLATMLFPLAMMGSPKNRQCGAGTLLDVQVNVETIHAGTSEHGQERVKKNGKKEYDGYSTAYMRKQTTYTVTVRIDDIIYTAQSEDIFGFGFKPTSFVVNDPIGACLRGNTLGLERPDGKEYRARIVRAVRTAPSD